MPNFVAIRRALDAIFANPDAKWQRICSAGEPRPIRELWVQVAGMELDAAAPLLAATTLHGKLPEALRLAHLIAGGVARGVSRGRA